MNNLPTWPGADAVYTRVQRINTVLCARDYEAQRAKDKRKNFQFSPSQEVLNAIDALGAGDEEVLKAYVATHLSLTC